MQRASTAVTREQSVDFGKKNEYRGIKMKYISKSIHKFEFNPMNKQKKYESNFEG